MGQRARDGIDALGRRCGIPLHSSGIGHLFGMHWAPERVVDPHARANQPAEDREPAPRADGPGCSAMSLGYFLISTMIGEAEVELGFLHALENALHRLGYVS